MNKSCCAVVLVASTALAALSVKAKIEVSQTTGFDGKHSWFRYTPYTKYRDMSGITWVGGNKFYVIRNNNYLSIMTVSLDDHGNLKDLPNMTEGYPLEGASDPEGIAYDNASGKIWVSDETGPTIREYDPVNMKNGKYVLTGREVRIPTILKRIGEGNRSLESLTISGDGLVMWTANEEALANDTYTYRVVRLVKFVRKTVRSEWSLAGMWAYECEDPYYAWVVKANGVADLLSLPDGSLVVMERSVDSDTWGACRLYKVDFANATDVTNVSSIDSSSITSGRVKLVGKSKLLSFSDGGYSADTLIDDCDGNGTSGHIVACYEGICLGPKNGDGSYNIMLVSDGGSRQGNAFMQPFVRALKLTGLNIHTLSVNKPAPAGDPTFYGQNYRFVHNAAVTNELYGEGFEPRAYTNCGDVAYSASWSLSGHKNSSGNGCSAVFNITNDCKLTWKISQKPTYADTLIYAHDTFEEYAKGTYGSIGRFWTGCGEVIENTYKPSQGANKYILKRADHKKVLDAEDGARRDISAMQLNASKSHRMDMMIMVKRAESGLPKLSGNPKFAIAADKDGCLNIWHYALVTVYDPLLRGNVLVRRNRWDKLSDTKYADGTWVHVSAEFCYTGSGAYSRVWLNGDECKVSNGNSAVLVPVLAGLSGQWVTLPSSSVPTNLVVKGTMVDDLIFASPEFIQSLPASASIMVSPSAVSGASAAGGQAYAVATAVPAPASAPALASSAPSAAQTSQSAVAVPAIIGFGIAPTKCPQIRFTGYTEGVEYRVVCSSTVDFRNASFVDGEIVKVQTGDDGVSVVATWEGAEPSDPASGAKFYRVEAVEAAAE